MARLFRLYEKKRGHRQTGSTSFGRFGETVFFGLFFAVGCASMIALLNRLVVPEWRANRHFEETNATVVRAEVTGRDSEAVASFRPDITINYTVDGVAHEVTTYDATRWYSFTRAESEAIVRRYAPGSQHPCWFDSLNPTRAVLVRGYSGWSYFLALIPLPFIVIGGGGLVYTLYHWNTSAERRAALAQRAREFDIFEAARNPTDEYPYIPADADWKNSPGTTLAYRLPAASAPGWRLFAALVACLLWNGVAMVFIIMAVSAMVRGEPNWPLTIFVLLVVAAGVWLIVYFVRQLLITTGVGPTRVEISSHPLRPGERYEILVTQAGRLNVKALEVFLMCEEKATYQQGTDTRTETRRVIEQSLDRSADFEIHQGMPYAQQCSLIIPEGAMHSFHSDHNEVRWRLVVRGSVDGWPDYERQFPVIVHPVGGATA